MLAYLLLIPRSDALVDVLANAHRQSLLPNRLVAVVSSDHHTVKPWFAGRADVSPVVADYAADGFRLVGGRVDAVQGHRAAVIVYAHGAHLINVFSWPKGPGFVPRDTIRFGYHLAFWHSGDLEYCAISDTNWSELHTLEELVRRSSDHDFIEEGTSGD
jgi:anti-sigma factor RsiW